jgi:hypothetical protein
MVFSWHFNEKVMIILEHLLATECGERIVNQTLAHPALVLTSIETLIKDGPNQVIKFLVDEKVHLDLNVPTLTMALQLGHPLKPKH